MILASLSSILSALVSAVYYGFTYLHFEEQPEQNKIISILLFMNLFLLVSLLTLSYYHFKNLFILKEKESRYDSLRDANSHKDIVIKSGYEHIHTVLHYYRNIMFSVNTLISNYRENGQNVKKEHCIEVLRQFDKFLCILLSNIKTHLDILTSDNCAASIKIYNDLNGKKLVKTFYRDDASFRTRQLNDFDQNGGYRYFDAEKDFAIASILSKDITNRYYICDNLTKDKNYKNDNNKNWQEYYNACVVIPISRVVLEEANQSPLNHILPKRFQTNNKKEILGFLCADNFKGNFETFQVHDFVAGFADILYILFKEYAIVATICQKLVVSNRRLDILSEWT